MSRTSDRTYKRNRAALKARRLPCHWCGLPIDYEAAPNTPMSFDADHLESLMSGGSNAGKLVAAHASCNRSRGARESNARRARVKHAEIVPTLSRWL